MMRWRPRSRSLGLTVALGLVLLGSEGSRSAEAETKLTFSHHVPTTHILHATAERSAKLFEVARHVTRTYHIMTEVSLMASVKRLIQHLGFHPVHFGIIAIMMLVYGSVTPPVGILAMVACRIPGIEYSRSFGMLVPYSVAWLAVVLLVAYVPPLALWLPSLMQ